MRRRKAFTLIELLVVVAIIALLISILLPALSRARETAKRAVCRANMRGIGQSEHIYANDYQDWFPQDLYNPVTRNQNEHDIDFVTNMGRDLEEKITVLANNSSSTHPSRSMFLLIIQGGSAPKSFICPSSSDTEDDMRNNVAANATAAQAGINRFDFKGYPFMSYGYQLGFARRGKARESMTGYSQMPVNADKGPFFDVSSRQGDPIWSTQDERRSDIGDPNFSGNAAFILRIDAETWRPYNSRNHNSEGQVVLFMDGHADFLNKPVAGINDDNIYTYQTGFELIDGLLGKAPEDRWGPLTDTDAVIVP